MLRVAKDKNIDNKNLHELKLERLRINNESKDLDLKNKSKKEFNTLNNLKNIKNKRIILKNKFFNIFDKNKKKNNIIFIDYLIITPFKIYIILVKDYYGELSIKDKLILINKTPILDLKEHNKEIKDSINKIFLNSEFNSKFNYLPKIINCILLSNKIFINDKDSKILNNMHIFNEKDFLLFFNNNNLNFNNKILNFKNSKKIFYNEYNIDLGLIINKIIKKDSIKTLNYYKDKKIFKDLNIPEELISKEKELIDFIEHTLERSQDIYKIETIIKTNNMQDYYKTIISLYNHKLNSSKSDINIIERLNKNIDSYPEKKINGKFKILSNDLANNKINLKLTHIGGQYNYKQNNNILIKDFIIDFKPYNDKKIQSVLNLLKFDKEKNIFKIIDEALDKVIINSIKDNPDEIFFGKRNHQATLFSVTTLYFVDDNNKQYSITLKYGFETLSSFEHVLKLIIQDNIVDFYTTKDTLSGSRIKYIKANN